MAKPIEAIIVFASIYYINVSWSIDLKIPKILFILIMLIRVTRDHPSKQKKSTKTQHSTMIICVQV